MKWIVAIWRYIKNSWEGDDGKLSYRRVSQYIFLVAMLKMAFRPPANDIELKVFYCFVGLYSIVACLITIPQLITILKLKNGILETDVKDGSDSSSASSSS
jgi:hypothetical protein